MRRTHLMARAVGSSWRVAAAAFVELLRWKHYSNL